MSSPASSQLSDRISAVANVTWLASLLMPVLVESSGDIAVRGDAWLGWMVLLVGPLGVFILCFAWYANLPFLLAVVLRKRASVWLAWSSLIIGLSFWIAPMKSIPYGDGSHLIVSYGAGMYVWYLALALQVISVHIAMRSNKSLERSRDE